MALVKCPECKKEISNKACTCPNCGYDFIGERKKKRRYVFWGIILVIILLLAARMIIASYVNTNRENQINDLLERAENYYTEMNLDAALECCDELDELGYGTEKLRGAIEYDIQNYDAGLAYRKALETVDEKLSFSKLENITSEELFTILSELSAATDDFNNLYANGINKDAKVGQYIYNVKNDPMFSVLWNDMLVKRATVAYNNYEANAVAIKALVEEILEVEFPYLKE